MTTFQRIVKYCAIALAVALIAGIIGGICSAIGIAMGLRGGSAAGEMRTYTVSGDVKRLDLEIGAAALQIVPGEGFSVESNLKKLTVKETGGTLKISEEKFFFGTSYEGVTVKLTVPEGFVFEDASLETGAGTTQITALSANTLSLELGAGKTDIDSLNVTSRAKISTGTGKLTVKDGRINGLSLELGVGKLELTSQLTGKCLVDMGVGDVDITLLGSKDDYIIYLDHGIGSATVDGVSMTDGSVGSGPNHIEIDGGVGAIRINFKEQEK